MFDIVVGNPIIQREVFSLIKSSKALGIQIVLALVFVLLVVIRWPTDSQVDLSNAQSIQVFRVFGYGLLIALLLFVPAFPAVSLVKEKSKGTLALLFNSQMSPLAIYTGKFLGVFAFVLLLICLSVPAVAACYAMGGIDLGQHVGKLYGVLILMGAQYTALGLLISSRSGSGDSSMRMTYFAVAMISSITLIPHLLFQGEGSMTATLADWLRCLSPFAAVMEIMGHASFGAQGRLEADTVAWRFMMLSLAVTIGFAVPTISQLNYRIFDRSRSQGKITDEQSRGVKAFRGVFFLVDPQRRKAGIRWVNPVFVKEFRTRRFGRIHWILRLVALCAVISVALTGLTAVQSQAWGPEIIGLAANSAHPVVDPKHFVRTHQFRAGERRLDTAPDDPHVDVQDRERKTDEFTGDRGRDSGRDTSRLSRADVDSTRAFVSDRTCPHQPLVRSGLCGLPQFVCE